MLVACHRDRGADPPPQKKPNPTNPTNKNKPKQAKEARRAGVYATLAEQRLTPEEQALLRSSKAFSQGVRTRVCACGCGFR